MMAGVRQLLGLALAIVSFVGIIIICALPQWRVIKVVPIDSRFADFQVYSEGLWKICVTSGAHLTRCVRYERRYLSGTVDLKVPRALIIIAIIIGVFGILLGVAGSKFINFVLDERKKTKMAMASGVAFLVAGIFVLIPVSWTTNTINDNFDDPHRDSLKLELGASIYIGWITTGLLFLGGGLLCSSFRRNGTD